ncbi:MAG TPA: glycosyltransferase family 2 protein, partial [Ilumatobacteraceae bacterium]
NVYMREIAEHLVEALAQLCRRGEVVIDDLPEAADAPLTNLVVAPHEFFTLSAASEPDRRRAAAASISINTEQPGTPLFDVAMTYATLGKLVFDIDPRSVDVVRRLQVPAVHLPLGCTPSMDAWGGGDSHRGIDFSFAAGRAPRRQCLLAGAGGMLWEWNTDLRFVPAGKPAELAKTRIMLNMHAGNEPYFEWAGVVDAIANGCAVVSENSVGFEPLVPGVHFLMAPFDYLAEQAIALAFDEPRRAAMADEAYKLAATTLAQSQLLDSALAEAERALATGDSTARRPRQPKRPRKELIAVTTHPFDKTASDLKAAYTTQLAMSRSIEATIATMTYGDRDYAEVSSTSAWDEFEPEVTVVIPVFNNGHFLGEAVHSVAAAAGESGPRAEVVIVDDHSTDDSRATAERLLDDVDWFPARLVARAANGGASVARNTGVATGRADFVFTLDADCSIYPTALRKLLVHLASAPRDVVAAYGILELFDGSGSVGLTSHLPWDPAMLMQTAEIDAMALYRRDEFIELGGFPSAPELHGWEHHDLWLSLAERGQRAELVRSIVGRRRTRGGQKSTLREVDVASTFVELRARHPRLPWPS